MVGPAAVTLSVTDDGPGVTPAILPHIFEKFASGAEPGRSDGRQSTGLGLAIARGIMKAHGGSIEVESPVADGRGARFVMAFPRERIAA